MTQTRVCTTGVEHVLDPDAHLCCKLRYWREGNLQVSPVASPAERRRGAPRDRRASNAWERGIKADHRGMPYLTADLRPIGLKEWSEKRHTYEGLVRQNQTVPTEG